MAQNITFDVIARDRASATFSKISRASQSTEARLKSFGRNVGAAVGFTGLTTAAIGFIKVGGQYQDSLNKIQALTGASAETTKRAAKTLEAQSSAYAKMGQTVGDAAEGVVELTKSGKSLDQSLKAVNATMVLAKAGQMSVADSASLVANTLNTFSLKASRAGDIANYLANAANISSADVSDLAESFKYVAPIAASTGVSLKQTNAILAELSNSGIAASNAGTGFRKFLLSLQAPSGRAATALKELNVNIFDAKGKMKPLTSIIDQLNKSMGGLSDQKRQADLKAIFGLQGVASATVILKNGSAGLDDYTRKVGQAGAAQKLADSASRGFTGTLKALRAEVISDAQAAYRELSPSLDQAAKKVLVFTQQMKSGKGAGGQLVGTLRDIGSVAGQAARDAAPLAKVLGGVIATAADDAHKIADAFNSLPKGVQNLVVAGGATAYAGKKLGLLGSLTSKSGALGTVAGGLGKGVVPVYVTNPGFGGPGGAAAAAGGGAAARAAAAAEGGGLAGDLEKVGAGAGAGSLLARLKTVLSGGSIADIGAKGLGLGKFAKLGLATFVAGDAGAEVRGKNYSDDQIRQMLRQNETNKLAKAAAEAAKKLRDQGTAQAQLNYLLRAGQQQLPKYTAMLKSLPSKVQTQIQTPGAVQSYDDVQKLAAQYKLTPKQVQTVLRLTGVTEAKSQLTSLQKQLLGIHDKTVHILVKKNGQGSGVYDTAHGGGTAPATSGPTLIPHLYPGPTGGSHGTAPRLMADASREGVRTATSYVGGLLKGLTGKTLAIQNAIDKVTARFQSASDKVGALQDRRSQYLSTFGSDSIFGADLTATGSSVAGLLQFQQQQQQTAQQLLGDIQSLTSRGLSTSLIKQLQSQGSSGAAQLHVLASASADQIRQLNASNAATMSADQQAGLLAGNYASGRNVDSDIAVAKRQEALLSQILTELKHSNGREIRIDADGIIRIVKQRNKRKGVATAGM